MNEVQVAAESSAAMQERLLSSKVIIRTSSPELSEKRRELICKLMDDLYQLGFTAGVEYMGRHILKASSLGGDKHE